MNLGREWTRRGIREGEERKQEAEKLEGKRGFWKNGSEAVANFPDQLFIRNFEKRKHTDSLQLPGSQREGEVISQTNYYHQLVIKGHTPIAIQTLRLRNNRFCR